MIRVVKVLNNSVVLAVEEPGGEVILMGKGIGFGKSIGQQISPKEGEQVFVLRDRQLNRNILQLAAQTDERIFNLTRRVVDYAVTHYQMRLADSIYLSLTDHLAFAVKRQEENLAVPGYYSVNVRLFNPKEYDVGRYALELVKKELGVELPEEESVSIAFHFINAQQDQGDGNQTRPMDRIVKGVLEIVKYTFGLEYDESSVSYSRFLTHVQAMAHRLVEGLDLSEGLTEFLYEQIVPQCPREYQCACKVAEFLDSSFHISLSRQESLYLTLHIHRVLEEWQSRRGKA